MILSDFHQKFPGSVRWRVTQDGVEIEGQGLIKPASAFLSRAVQFIKEFGSLFVAAAAEYGVPVELLIANSLTESAIKNPVTCIRKEPGYVSDEKTPHRISAGMCQLLISTARDTMNDPSIGRDWLFVPINSIRACASYLKWLNVHKGTGYDPVLSACAYNAGGLYQNLGVKNRWKLRQYPLGTSEHADRFCGYFAAVSKHRASITGKCPRITDLL